MKIGFEIGLILTPTLSKGAGDESEKNLIFIMFIYKI
jgi:hypothetical protein